MAICLKRTDLADDQVSLLISDQISGCQQMIKNLEREAVFASVSLVGKSLFKRMENSKWRRAFFHWGNAGYVQSLLKRSMAGMPDACDLFLCANIELFGIAFCRTYGCELELFEDGIASYSMEMGDFYQVVSKPSGREKKRRYACYANAKRIYFFCPERLKWEPPFEVKRLESFAEDKYFVQSLNRVFGYDPQIDPYLEKYIFFEEAYRSDGRLVDDMDIVERTAQIVGKEQILIKRHPRSQEDRFGRLGFSTNVSCGIPWEVIALNICLDEKVIITIASAAAITPYLLLGMKMKAVLLYKMFQDAPLKRDVLEVLEAICEENSECLTPGSMDEYMEVLKNVKER